MINLYFLNNKIFLWNAEDVSLIREKNRIVGSLVGCYPANPFQSHKKWLPLQLMPEEAKLLIDKGFAQIVIKETKTDEEEVKQFYIKRDNICKEQEDLWREKRKREILEKTDEIYEGKKRKYLESLKLKSTAQPSEINQNLAEKTDEKSKTISEQSSENESELLFPLSKTEVIETEITKIACVNRELCLVQLFTESPWKSKLKPVAWKFPFSEEEKLRYATFKDLWEKNYYVTAGSKFGGDFLAYEGDPLKYHAVFIVVCINKEEQLRGSDIVVYGRLGQQVKKTVALASLSRSGQVEYISISWQHELI